jgi:AraC-like DNA-binding protein
MVQTLIVRPTGILKDYIQAFELREFDTCGHEFKKPVHAFHEALISLFIDCKLTFFDAASDPSPAYIVKNTTQAFSGVMGLQSYMRGSFVFQGYFKIFNIQFKPMGFSSIFKIPASLIMNKLYDLEDIFNQDLEELHEQLHEAKSMAEMVGYAESFLEKKLLSNNSCWKNKALLIASEFLLNQPNTYSIEQLAYHFNMTLKTFERKFTEQVGMPPKLFARIRRFNLALYMKLYQKDLSWMDICFQTGYYDQMHLSKDFKTFAGQPPCAFFKNTPPPFENFSSL